MGLQGVDNGSLRFSGARIPRENLLDRFGTVDSTGQYRWEFDCNLHDCTLHARGL